MRFVRTSFIYIVPTDAIVFYSTMRKNGPWTQNSGSTQGGTMLWIYGNRFAQTGFNTVPSTTNTNFVQLVDGYSVHNCTIHEDKVTNTQLTCYTPKMPEGVYQIRVYVNENLIPLYQYYDPKRATFVPMSSQTPTITGITPLTATPRSLISLSGSFKSPCFSRDMDGCSQDNNPLISRIYMGGQLCNVINPITGANYSEVTDSNLLCNFDSNEVGVFNISMIVTNEYGRSMVRSDLYRISATGQLYNFQTYAIVSSVSPTMGSIEGGTTLVVSGQYFSHTTQYPIIVQVAGEICIILNVTLTTIQCRTPVNPSLGRSQYQGGRGLQVFSDQIIASMSSVNPQMPSINANQTWIDDALYVSTSSTNETVWIIGFIRVPTTATFSFILKTNGYGALFLSTNDSPINKTKIADATSGYQSSPIVLQNNTNYYLLCVGSRIGGNLSISIQARMHETTLTAGTSSLVTNEIQRIDINATVTNEKQSIIYTMNSTSNGTAEVQTIAIDNSTFQIGFYGVYTGLLNGRPTASLVQAALNDLPTIYPLSVRVESTSSLYIITFPVEMGDVPLLNVISTAANEPNVTETIQGVASGTKLAFQLDGATTRYLDFVNNNLTQANLTSAINELFTIRCPVSLNNPQATSSIVYVQEFETGCIFDETRITSNAFCGQCSLTGNTLVSGNTRSANYLCFAYKIFNSYVTEIGLGIQINGDTTATYWTSISFSPVADKFWHYTCVDVRATLTSQSSMYSTAFSFVIINAWLNQNIRQGIMIDTVTVRTVLPIGYEDQSLYPIDGASNFSSCNFPFYYNGESYSACTLDNNSMAICANILNQTFQCQSSSIEGVRRLYPKRQLVYNTLQVAYTPVNSTINISFRYSDCSSPTLFSTLPATSSIVTSITQASPAASGTFDLNFNGQTYSSISVNIDPIELINRLQASSDFGFLKVTRSRDCTGYSYTIEWLSNGGQKSNILVSNTSGVMPIGTIVTSSVTQRGGILFNPLPGDITRTYHTTPQVEVFVGGYLSKCANTNNSCQFEWSLIQTPTVSSIVQSGMTLSITGTDFSTVLDDNIVLIDVINSCIVTAATSTSITCTIDNAPSGTYTLSVNVVGKGLASNSANLTVTIPLQIASFSPSQGGAGGGYLLTIMGTGFSLTTVVTVDNNLCSNAQITNFSLITCIVPATTAISNQQVVVSVIVESNIVNASSLFTYDITNTPNIWSISPTLVTMTPGQLTIVGNLFGNTSVSVSVGSINAAVISTTSTQIVANLPYLPPGRYPIMVSTMNGFARPPVYIEYYFYVQQVSPQVGSLYGGTDVYVQGEGFDNSTSITFCDSNNRQMPCKIISVQSSLIHCQTTPAVPEMIITSNGVDPTYGTGFAWSPQYATVQQGALVTWQWGSSALLSSLKYKVQQVANAYATEPLSNGFDSGTATSSGSFSYQFVTLGTYYYWSTVVDQAGIIILRGVITVVDAQPQILTVQAISNSFTAQSCVFPFTYNSVSYTACTTMNDTQPWCSPSSVYTGQRLYCTPRTSVPVSSCGSSSNLNPSLCLQTVPSAIPLEFLSTSCTLGSVTLISPVQGTAGTTIIITGTGFSTVACENDVQIGSSYHCPITSASSTQLQCQIGVGSLINAKTRQIVQVARDRQGYLTSDGQLCFQFQASISNVSPNFGTEVTINGDGFMPGDTRLIIAGTDYSNIANISYTRIVFTTPSQMTYINQNLTVVVLIGMNEAICLNTSCTFQWSTSITPYLDSVSPNQISGPTALTLTGRNLIVGGGSASDTLVTISGNPCNITSMTNTLIGCQLGDIEAGNHSIAGLINGVGFIISTVHLTSTAILTGVSPRMSGIYGGILLIITGNGFSSNISNIRIMVGSNQCRLVQATTSQLQCTVPPQGSQSSVVSIAVTSNGITLPGSFSFVYNSSNTPYVSSVNPTSGSVSQSLTINGSNFILGQTSVFVGNSLCNINNVSTTSITCTLGSSSAGVQPVTVYVTTTGNSNSDVQFTYILQVTSVSPAQGSYGGGQTVRITGDGFNATNTSVSVCNRLCQTMTIVSNTELLCITPSATLSILNTLCNLTVSVDALVRSVSFVYQANLTAIITNVSPTRGGTGGGTTLTINGTNFPSSINVVSVSIAGIPCIVQTINPTGMTCLTGSYQGITVLAPIIVSINGSGNAVGSPVFQYIDLWSSPWTWGGNAPPEEGTIVLINNGKTVYFDTTTPTLKAIIIDNASLIFDDTRDVALNAEYILVVNGGLFQVGTESNPFQHRAVITMYGHLRSIELPIFGAKVLAVREGIIDMHGKPTVQMWTHLAMTAVNGSSTITLRQAVDWTVGSEIIIATTGDYLSQGESEKRTITGISNNGLTLTLNTPLNWTHLGVTQNLGSISIDARAEVGLLSHNVVFQGSVTETWNQTIKACPGDEFAIQTCFLGRYGEEIGSDQFGATIMASGDMDKISNGQQVILRLSNIEVTNPNNTVEHNAVAGGTHFGYWYRMLRTPDGPSFAMYPDFCPYRQPFGRFFNNSVHSCGQFGVWIFPEYVSTVGGSCWADAPKQPVFERLTSWRNTKGFEAVMSNVIQVKSAVVFDNIDMGIAYLTAIDHRETNLPNLRATFYDINTGASVIDSIIIGDSNLADSPVIPWRGGLVVVWDRGLRVRNVSFINFQSSQTQAMHGPVKAGRCAVFCGGWTTKFSQMSFTNVTNRALFRWPYDGLYLDEDGTLGGLPNATIMPPDSLWNTSTACVPASNFLNAIRCPASLGRWLRFAFNGANLGQNGEPLVVYDMSNHSTVIPYLRKRLTHPFGYMAVLQAKQTYTLEFVNANSTVNLSYTGAVYDLAAGDYLIFRHKVAYLPDQVYTVSSLTMTRQSSTPLSGLTSNNGDWYYDNVTTYFYYIVKNPSNNATSIDVVIPLKVIKCRYPNCEYPSQPAFGSPATVRPSGALFWSNDSHWSFATQGFGGFGAIKPGNDTDIYIPRGVWLVVDYPLPRILSLRIDGVLEFEQGMNNILYVNSVFINGGWPNNPLNSSVDIVITGDAVMNVLLPNDEGSMGSKVIGVFGGLDLHGIKHNITWTRLASTASSGQNTIILIEPVDWIVGDEIIITTTDTNIQHTERHRIAYVGAGGTTIVTVNPLDYTHIAIRNVFPNGQVLNISSAVGLLSRNVRVINQSPASDLFGYRILVTDYATNVWNPVANESIYTYYKGYARISNTQFIGYGQFFDAPDEDKREGIHLYNLGDWNASRPTYVDSCSFDGGSYSAIGIWNASGVPITNNIIYNTYQSAIVITGKNNIINHNLVATVYWSGTAQPEYAEFNINYDGAIMSRDAISVVMRDNMVAGVERLAYRIQCDACSGTNIPSNISNDYWNNEAHSAMTGVNIWPTDKGFDYDLALTHIASNNSVHIHNTIVVGSIIPNDCADIVNSSSISIALAPKAIPTVASPNATDSPQGRCGIVFPYISPNNKMPVKPWTGIKAYPSVDGGMFITNTTLAFFNDVCGRHDTAIQVGQHNDDGQFPVMTSSMSIFNTSRRNIIFNGRPNLQVVNSADCVDMDCDGLKKALLIDMDGTFFGQPGSAISQAEYLWGDQQHGIGDFRIPFVALSNMTGHQINISATYPYRGINLAPTCAYESAWQMYFCNNTLDYRMLIIESMDPDTETRRLSPVAIMSDNGYIDLINGPQDHGCCNGYTCRKRVSTFMAIVESYHTYLIYLTSTQPNQMRFRVLNSDARIKVILALRYDSLQQIDVYANDIYVSPTNRDSSFSFLMLTDQSNNVTFSSPAGSNYFNRTTQMAYFAIDGLTVIDLKISPLLVLTFRLPPVTPSSFFSNNLVTNLATLLGVNMNMIRRVNIISANNNTRVRRQNSMTDFYLQVELYNEPANNLTSYNTTQDEVLLNLTSTILSQYQSGELQAIWARDPSTNNTSPTGLTVQEPFSQTMDELKVINRIELVTQPSSCREQSPCTIQPVIVAYDSNGNIIQKLGSIQHPWQVIASLVGQPNAFVPGSIANYSNGQTQYSLFGLASVGTYQVQFMFISPMVVIDSSFMTTSNFTVISSIITVTQAILAGIEVDHVYVTTVNEQFNVSVMPIDSVTRRRIGQIIWGNWTWARSVSFYAFPQCNRSTTLIISPSSRTLINLSAGTVTITDIAINATGMFILNISLVSTNNMYTIQVITNGILVKSNNNELEVETGDPDTYINSDGNYDSLAATDVLELTRVIIYNNLLCIGMPVTSDITLWKEIGSDRWPLELSSKSTTGLIAAFIVGSSQTQVATAVNMIKSNPNIMPQLKILSITIRSQAYSISSPSGGTGSSSTTENTAGNTNTIGLIVGLVVGIVGGLILLIGIILGLKAYKDKHERVFSKRDDMVNLNELLTFHNDHDPIIQTETKDKKNFKILKNEPPTALQLHPSHIQLHPSIEHVESDIPPGALTTTPLDYTIPHDGHNDGTMMPEVEKM
ncbi:unnamed protein product [Rotaria sp. Silwood2]|nr:unnamed protein product [Rotaria sp. Silwood2]